MDDEELIPMKGRVIAQKVDREDKTKSGIVLAGNCEVSRYKVVATSLDESSPIKVGDIIYTEKGSGVSLSFQLIAFKEEDIVAKEK